MRPSDRCRCWFIDAFLRIIFQDLPHFTDTSHTASFLRPALVLRWGSRQASLIAIAYRNILTLDIPSRKRKDKDNGHQTRRRKFSSSWVPPSTCYASSIPNADSGTHKHISRILYCLIVDILSLSKCRTLCFCYCCRFIFGSWPFQTWTLVHPMPWNRSYLKASLPYDKMNYTDD